MRIESAIRLIDLVIYKPGWSFEAEDHSKRFEGSILVTVRYVAQESGRPNAELGYPETIKTYAKFPLLVGDINSEVELMRRLADCIMCIEEHEMREFLRMSPTYWAPFHPHQIDGMKTWHHTSGQPNFLSADLQFGIG